MGRHGVGIGVVGAGDRAGGHFVQIGSSHIPDGERVSAPVVGGIHFQGGGQVFQVGAAAGKVFLNLSFEQSRSEGGLSQE